MVRDKEVLELATGPGLLAKHIAPSAKTVLATDYSDGMIAEAKKGVFPENPLTVGDTTYTDCALTAD